ncbi:unnamed protein product, partial [Allacma fusca]
LNFSYPDLYIKWRLKKDSSWTTIYPEEDENFYALTNLTCGSSYQILLGNYDGIREYFHTKPVEATTLNQALPSLSQEEILVRLNSTAATLRFHPWIYANCPASGISIEMKEKSEAQWSLLYFTHTPFEVSIISSCHININLSISVANKNSSFHPCSTLKKCEQLWL